MDNDTLENTANEALKGMIEASANASNWALSEIPEVIGQLLAWKFAESLLFFMIGIGLLFTSIAIGVLTFRKIQREKLKWWREDWITPVIAFNVVTLILSPAFIFLNLDWLQIWVAPKVYLIEYAAQIL